MEQTRAMTAEWPLLSPAAVQTRPADIPGTVCAGVERATSAGGRRGGVADQRAGEAVWYRYRDVRLTTIENGKQVPTSWWNARGVAAIRPARRRSRTAPGDTLRLV